MVANSLDGVDLAAFCGALPPGAPLDGYGRLIHLVQSRGIPVIVDARGDYLHHALLAKPHIVKVNAEEAGEVTGLTIESPEDAAGAAQKIRDLGVAQVIITLGKKGAVAAGEGISSSTGTIFAPAPQVESICAVGSGDAFLGGLAYALQRGESFEAALKLGVACGSANTLCIGQGIFEISLAKELAGEIQII
jgi:fructose-1-phosphate kinase PfkB-like protein